TSTFDCNRYLHCDDADDEYDAGTGECAAKRGQHVHVGFRYHPAYSTGNYSRPEFINRDYKYLYVGYDTNDQLAHAGVPIIETMRVKIPRRQRRKWFHFIRRLNWQSPLDDKDVGQF